MAKRFTDTDKWKKPLFKAMPAAYKLLWLYICDDCDHAGIWQVDINVAKIRICEQLDINQATKIFADKIVVFDDGNKWFIPSFIDFQYGELNPLNRAHQSVIKILRKYNLIDQENKPLASPLQGAKDKDKVKEQEKEDRGVGEEVFLPVGIAPDVQLAFCKQFPKYPKDKDKDFPACLQIAYAIAEELHIPMMQVTGEKKGLVMRRWGEIIKFIATDKWFSKRSLSQINNEWQSLVQSMTNGGSNHQIGTSAARIQAAKEW